MVVLVYCRLDTIEKKVNKYEGTAIETMQIKNRKRPKKKASVS